MPEAPPEAHAFLPAKHNLAAHLAHSEVQKRIVAGLAGDAGSAADSAAGRDGLVMGPPAEGAEICDRVGEGGR